MAGPVNGIGGQQQVPLSQPFQPGGSSEQVRREEPKGRQIESQSQAAAESNQSERDEDQTILQQLLREAQQPDSGGEQQSARRGSVVDLSV